MVYLLNSYINHGSVHMAMAQNYQPPKWMVFLLNMIISVGHWYHNFEPSPYEQPASPHVPMAFAQLRITSSCTTRQVLAWKNSSEAMAVNAAPVLGRSARGPGWVCHQCSCPGRQWTIDKLMDIAMETFGKTEE